MILLSSIYLLTLSTTSFSISLISLTINSFSHTISFPNTTSPFTHAKYTPLESDARTEEKIVYVNGRQTEATIDTDNNTTVDFSKRFLNQQAVVQIITIRLLI